MGGVCYEDPRGARHWVHLRATDLYAVGSFNPDHDAVMRIGGEAVRSGGGSVLATSKRHSESGSEPAETFSLMANEPGMVWQSNAHLYILTGVQYPRLVTRLLGSWNVVCRAEVILSERGCGPHRSQTLIANASAW